ncbi:hypothetical protein E2C01_063584 [Portunus trituberculatus]|uniref:Uncharacterized protein n=1 Tax=Portunus trituberculatus TaxID=210409 RepID=A0A5B7H9J1_PORTR|nr:hypothetical protein [Portunus trituberculatus]
MRLRGLCKDSAFDKLFSFRDSDNYELVFDGLAHVMMEEQNNTWIMRSRLYPYLKAKMISQWVGQYPVGVHTWIIEGDRCRQKEVGRHLGVTADWPVSGTVLPRLATCSPDITVCTKLPTRSAANVYLHYPPLSHRRLNTVEEYRSGEIGSLKNEHHLLTARKGND